MKHMKQYNVMIFAVLILAAGTVYKVPYLKSVFMIRWFQAYPYPIRR